MVWKILVSILFLSSPIFSMEIETYLVYRQSYFPQDRYLIKVDPATYKLFAATGRLSIDSALGQPSAITTYKLSADGKYAVWVVSPSSSQEEASISKMLSEGYIYKMGSQTIAQEVDERTGAQKLVARNEFLESLPDDFVVLTSTP